jgi:drug/metabolite transporter (DMT)-like permease
MPSRRITAVIALAATMLFWGSGGVFVRSLALAIEPQNALAIRYSLLTVVSIAGLIFFSARIGRSDWPRLLFAAIGGIVGFNVFANYGLALIPAGTAGIITSTEPLVIALGAFVSCARSSRPMS